MVGLFTMSLATEDDPQHTGSPMDKLLPGKTHLWQKGNFHLVKPAIFKLSTGVSRRGEEPSFLRHTHRLSSHLLVPFKLIVLHSLVHFKLIVLHLLVPFKLIFLHFWCQNHTIDLDLIHQLT